MTSASSRAGVVTFGDDERLAAPLTSSEDRLRLAIGNMSAGELGEARIDLGLAAAHLALEGRDRPAAVPVVVVLAEDGGTGDVAAVMRQADALRGAGIVVYVIGLAGQDGVLAQVATDGRYFIPRGGGGPDRAVDAVHHHCAGRRSASALGADHEHAAGRHALFTRQRAAARCLRSQHPPPRLGLGGHPSGHRGELRAGAAGLRFLAGGRRRMGRLHRQCRATRPPGLPDRGDRRQRRCAPDQPAADPHAADSRSDHRGATLTDRHATGDRHRLANRDALVNGRSHRDAATPGDPPRRAHLPYLAQGVVLVDRTPTPTLCLDREQEPNDTPEEALAIPALCRDAVLAGTLPLLVPGGAPSGPPDSDDYRIEVDRSGSLVAELWDIPPGSNFDLFVYDCQSTPGDCRRLGRSQSDTARASGGNPDHAGPLLHPRVAADRLAAERFGVQGDVEPTGSDQPRNRAGSLTASR